jgi:hypothetical protein
MLHFPAVAYFAMRHVVINRHQYYSSDFLVLPNVAPVRPVLQGALHNDLSTSRRSPMCQQDQSFGRLCFNIDALTPPFRTPSRAAVHKVAPT